MNKLIVTTGESGVIEIDFGIYYTNGTTPFKKAYYSKNYIIKSHLMNDYILVWGTDMRTFDIIAPNGNTGKGLEVESINGIAPTDLNHLFTLVKSILE